jgi:hypothetical protein
MRELFLVCDGVANSVFYNQVYLPLVERAEKDSTRSIDLVLCERDVVVAQKIVSQLPLAKGVSCHIVVRPWYVRSDPFSLRIMAHRLAKAFDLKRYQQLWARGPLAGYVIRVAALKQQCDSSSTPIKIQARGLAAEEYRFMQRGKGETYFATLKSRMIAWGLEVVEYCAYADSTWLSGTYDVAVHTVSYALASYLHNKWGGTERRFIVDKRDVPPMVSFDVVQELRSQLREAYDISSSSTVYMYSGSTHPWQEIGSVVRRLAEFLDRDSSAYAVVMSQDIKPFQDLCSRYDIDTSRWRFIVAKPSDASRYTAMADYGLLLRAAHAMNWVARPTKVLEYQSSGGVLIHNNTVQSVVASEGFCDGNAMVPHPRQVSPS